MKQLIDIYTDGSCLKNPGGPGGWAALIAPPTGAWYELTGSDPETTNNRMEMMAALSAMNFMIGLVKKSALKDGIAFHVDSEYVKKGMTEWMPGWKKRQWRNAEGKPVLNKDLWLLLDDAKSFFESNEIPVSWNWVKAHNGHPINERVDQLANKAAREQSPYRCITTSDNPVVLSGGADSKKPYQVPFEDMEHFALDLSLSDAVLAAIVREKLIKKKAVSFSAL